MSDTDLTIRINTKADTDGVDKTRKSLDSLSDSGAKNVSFIEKLNGAFAPLAAVTASAGIGLSKLTQFMGSSVGEANNLQAAMTGLNSIARAFKQDAGAATQAAKDLAKDGLMTVGDAATGLKNLLASGFSLDQAIKLMNGFKDSAAFGKQGALSFGEAIRGATEGIKNGNSILVDNAGVTKNLSMILTDAGYSAQDLMKATSDAGVRQALFNGILKETAPMAGDAAKLTNSYAGSQAKAAAQTSILKQNIGTALQSALLPFLQAITPIIVAISNWVQQHQKLSAMIGIAMAIFLGLIVVIGAIGTVISALTPIIAVFGAVTIGWVLLIVAAFAAAVAAIIVFWTPIKDFFVKLWWGIQGVIDAFIGWVRNNWPLLIGIMTGPIGLVVGIIANNFNGILNFIRGIPGIIAGIWSGLTRILTAPFEGLWNFMSSLPSKVASLFSGMGGMIRTAIGNIDIPGPLGRIRDVIPGFATGVRNFSGGMAVVGEQGPELVNLPKGADVYTNGESKSMMGSAGASTTITIGDVHLGDASAVDRFFNRLDRNNELSQRGLTTARI